MATFSAPGIGAGIDGNSIITQLLAIQARPLNNIKRQQSAVQAQISAYGSLKSAVSTFKSALSDLVSADKFKQHAATSSDESAFTVSATSSAAAGNSSITVVSLADSHKRASSAYADAVTDIGGTGTIDITVNGSTSSITVAAGATLTDIKNAINEAGDNPGVTASIINEAGGSRLILTSDDTGLTNAISITTTDDDLNNTDALGLSKLFYVGTGADQYAREITAAADANLTVDGFTVNSASNSVTGVIEGVTIKLEGAGSGTLAVASDDEAVTETVQGFVTAYNDLRSTLSTMYENDLNRDSTIRTIEQSLLSIMGSSTTTTGVFTHLSSIGITRDKEGTMSLDSSKLTTALSTDFDSVTALFSDATEGIAVRLESYADDLLDFDGLLATREEGLNNRIRSFDDQIDRWKLRLVAIEKRYAKQFASLDATIAGLQGTSSFLSAQMTSLIGGR